MNIFIGIFFITDDVLLRIRSIFEKLINTAALLKKNVKIDLEH